MDNPKPIRLGVNVDHVATLRNARGGVHPDPVAAALLAIEAGADGITVHLREDRRHIRDDDVVSIREAIRAPLNFEMAATEEMVGIAMSTQPNAVCIVPEHREELTTEGGLAVVGHEDRLTNLLRPLKEAGIRISLFIEANELDIESARRIGADIVELHTGKYCDNLAERSSELCRIRQAAAYGANLGIEIHAGHGLGLDTVGPIAAIPEVEELNIGHFLIGESVFCGIEAAIIQLRQKMQSSRYIDKSDY